MSNRFEKKIENAISRHALLRRDGFYIVALSGGPDSVALLRALVAMGYQVHAAHCNFHLRGEESNRDEHFCEALCGRVGVTMHSSATTLGRTASVWDTTVMTRWRPFFST